MKKYFFLIFALIGFSCSNPQSTLKTKTTEKNTVNYASLADYLTANGRVAVTGYDEGSIRLQVRGINSILGDTRPFIYVDGSPIGRSYKLANEAVNPNNIRSVRVLASLSELAVYGENGNSGVILIKTRSRGK